ncbi:MAG: DHH family phosphoesterase, partial [Butyrivibrio sp.]|nr:DHH family phosphoesterase [Butyrivibrio sp.]
MNILKTILSYENIVIQCHDNPDADALASGFALKWYLKRNGKDARFIYGGKNKVTKSNLVLMMEKLGISAEYVTELERPDLLVTVDCQYGESNVTKFDAKNVIVIDHHQVSGQLPEIFDVRSNYGSCASVLYKLFLKEKIDINEDENLATALYYGLMTDTGGFEEISHPVDRDLRDYAKPRQSDIILFKNSNLSRQELIIAG